MNGTLNGAAVTGTAWMDHEWFTHQLDPDQRGWDWFSIQLENGTELMLFQLRRTDGSIDPFSSGTYIARDGRAVHLKRSDFTLAADRNLDQSPDRGALSGAMADSVPSQGVNLECRAALDDQELSGENPVIGKVRSHTAGRPAAWGTWK